jgi:DNA-directed RNA polymerase specialized sigma24 family protein
VAELVQQVLLQAESSPSTPPHEPDRTRYIHAIARNTAKAHLMGLALDRHDESFDESGEGPAPAYDAPVDHASRELVLRILDEADAADPKGLDWLLRAKVEGEPVRAIAASEGVAPEHVWQRVTRLRQRLQSAATALGALATVVLLVFFITRWKLRDHAREHGESDVASSAPTPRERAATLRQHAIDELGHGDAAGCLRHLDEARELDPAGETRPEVVQARKQAKERLAP